MRHAALRRTVEIWHAEGARGVAVRGLARIRLQIGHAARRLRFFALRALRRGQDEQQLIRDSAEYWNRGDRHGIDLQDYSHWRGAGPWRDTERWLKLGRPHRRLYEKLRRITASPPALRIVEWGCGGGANAVHFVDGAREFCGIEIAQASLDECRRVLSESGFHSFRGVLIAAAAPEQALAAAGDGYDLFLCTYVFELIPSREYGERILAIACSMLRPGGLALVQIRYDDGTERSSQKQLDYFSNSTRFTSYRIDEFWTRLQKVGFVPEFVWLAPAQSDEFSGDLYAYFGVRKPATSPAAASAAQDAHGAQRSPARAPALADAEPPPATGFSQISRQ